MLQAMTFRFRTYFPAPIILHLMLIVLMSTNILLAKTHSRTRALSDEPLLTKRLTANRLNPQEVTALELGKTIDRELASGQKHAYQIMLDKGQYANILVEQRGIDVTVKLLRTDGKAIVEFDFESRVQGTETVELIADAAGSYKLSIEATQGNALGGYEIRVVELREATEKDHWLQEARKSFTASGQLRRAGNLGEAFKQAERALEIRERELGPEHLEVALTLDTVAFFYFRKGDLAKAESLVRRALAIKEKTLEPGHPEIAQTLNSLGLVMEYEGDLVQAEELYKRALEIRERAFGPDHTAVAGSLNSLAGIYVEWRDYAKAELLYQRSLELKEKLMGADSISVADALNNLAIVSRNLGDYAKAESQNLRALTIYEKAQGPDHPSVAMALINLALVYNEKAAYSKSEQALRRALEIERKKLEPDHPTVAQTLYNLGNVYFFMGDIDKAEPLYQQALAILEKRLGASHQNLAFPLRSLGGVYRLKGDYDKAEFFFRRALEVREKAFGPDHPSVGETLSSLATLYAAKGDAVEAIKAEARVNELAERNVSLNLISGSDLMKLAYLSSLSQNANHTISLGVRLFPEDAAARRLAATTVLLRKGRVQDAMANSLSTLRHRLNEQDQKLLEEFSRTTAQLARLVLNGPQQMTLAEHQNRTKALEEKREKLESEISRLSAGYYEKSQPITLASVQSAVPTDAALIEFALYRPFDPKATSKQKELGEFRYAVYVLRHQGEIQWKDLGEARPLDGLIEQLRQALRDPKRKDVQQLARALDEKVMQPVRALTKDATHLLISPDGALNLIPFEALVDEQGKYLLEHYVFTYLTSGRDLLRLQVARESKSPPVIVADPLFGEPAMAQVAETERRKTKLAARNTKRQSVTTGTDMANVYFAPLSGTAGEARVIKSLFTDAQVLTGAAATESAIKQVNVPRILHIATHGFFLTDTQTPASTPSPESTRAIKANVKIENPLLRSGLALAGANLKDNPTDDGILTALEASGLNLWGTQLVTLSACDTGIGEVKNGEGVYGLRRAFMLAGAESLMMSLWPVSDYVTRELMTNYYKNLKQGLGRGEALRQVQLAMLKRKGREHPFYWASFIQAGEWANLDGKR